MRLYATSRESKRILTKLMRRELKCNAHYAHKKKNMQENSHNTRKKCDQKIVMNRSIHWNRLTNWIIVEKLFETMFRSWFPSKYSASILWIVLNFMHTINQRSKPRNSNNISRNYANLVQTNSKFHVNSVIYALLRWKSFG